jgi:hypothetical protein
MLISCEFVRHSGAERTMGKVFGKVVDHERDIPEAVCDFSAEAFYRQILPPEGNNLCIFRQKDILYARDEYLERVLCLKLIGPYRIQ